MTPLPIQKNLGRSRVPLGASRRSLLAACVTAALSLGLAAPAALAQGQPQRGEGSILGSMVGALVMAFLRNGSQQMGWPTYVQEILIGVIIVVAVAVDRWRHAQGDGE